MLPYARYVNRASVWLAIRLHGFAVFGTRKIAAGSIRFSLRIRFAAAVAIDREVEARATRATGRELSRVQRRWILVSLFWSRIASYVTA